MNGRCAQGAADAADMGDLLAAIGPLTSERVHLKFTHGRKRCRRALTETGRSPRCPYGARGAVARCCACQILGRGEGLPKLTMGIATGRARTASSTRAVLCGADHS